MTNKIKISEIKEVFKDVFNNGYGNTINLKINGEYYEVINDLK